MQLRKPDPNSRRVTDPNRKVHVVGHQAVRMDPMPETLDALGDKRAEPLAVGVVAEDRLPTVATQHDVVQPTTKMNARLAGYGLVSLDGSNATTQA